MESGLRRMLFAILAGLALAGLIVMVIAILMTPAGLQWWLYGALAIVLIALIAEVVLLVVTRQRPPSAADQYDFVIDANESDAGGEPR